MLTGLNHITIAVSDLTRSMDFYTNTLGFTAHAMWNNGAYLTLGELWLCLSVDDRFYPKLDYTHIAFSIDASNFKEFVTKLERANVPQWKANTSEGQSCYILDPDGHKLEIHVGDLKSRLQTLKTRPYEGLVWL